jgi:BlaI family transcriptional regulator, penicillinase repressor
MRAKKIKLSPFELEIMTVLWKLGKASVREIQELLPETRRPAYTTVQTMVYRLEEKGALQRVRKIGNAHIFEPLISRREAHHRLINDLLDLFGGSVQPLMAHLIEVGKLTLEDVRELETALQKIEKNERPRESVGRAPRSGHRKGGRDRIERKTP